MWKSKMKLNFANYEYTTSSLEWIFESDFLGNNREYVALFCASISN